MKYRKILAFQMWYIDQNKRKVLDVFSLKIHQKQPFHSYLKNNISWESMLQQVT
jgi:hypothetical protein